MLVLISIFFENVYEFRKKSRNLQKSIVRIVRNYREGTATYIVIKVPMETITMPIPKCRSMIFSLYYDTRVLGLGVSSLSFVGRRPSLQRPKNLS